MSTVIPGPRLRQWLEAAGMTQAQLGRLLHVDAGQVSRWCHDKASLRGDYAAAVAELLLARGVKIESLATTCRIFFSTPMAALDAESYDSDRTAACLVYDELCRIAAPVYWPASTINTVAQFEAPDLATERNLVALTEASAFVYLQLRALCRPTSCHVEMGMAIARRTPVTVFAPSEDSLPYALHRFEAVSTNVGFGVRYRFYAIRGAEDAVRLLAIHNQELLGLAA